ncbi:chaperone modulator CbpM [Actinomycetospora lemnae]|uniref:Chaperone modulator CbpM n=1 Tax=Actinomycetospora lemnae TaxID=3019891 RepID=A0ABT5SZB6_9PSEU|nr:chaperone modulator CbpM [Actinomycetospora sp. DW7H6]MDD7968104.1 chaperone modulator CbpM [Actinomycetospora sp. DW7H6]
MTVHYLPVRRPPTAGPQRRLSREEFCRRSGVHPELLRRFVALGLVQAVRDPGGELRFPPGQLADVARIERLRRGLGLNYAAIGLVCELLDRIQELERQLRERSS